MAYIEIYKREIGDLLSFLRNPRRKPHGQAQGWGWPVRMLVLWLPTLLFALLISAALQGLAKPLGLFNTLEVDRFTFVVMLGSCLLAPLIEEVVFRWGLRSATYTLFVGPAAATGILVHDKLSGWVFLAICGSMLAMAFLFRHRRKSGKLSNMQFSRQFLTNYPQVFWLYTTAFALTHIANYSISTVAGLGAVALFQMPQFLMGLVAGYLRLRDGLRSSIAMHILHNTAAVCLVVVLTRLGY